MLTVVGYPRSGTNFLNRMLAHYIDGPSVNPWNGMRPHPHVGKIHWAYQNDGRAAIVYIYRDPRDCALSGREYIQNCFASKRLDLMDFLENYFAHGWDLWPNGWRGHSLYWMEKHAATVCYETLCAHREQELQRLVGELKYELDAERVAYAVEQSYRFGTHRVNGKCESRSGRWVREMPLGAVLWMHDYCGDVVRQLKERSMLHD